MSLEPFPHSSLLSSCMQSFEISKATRFRRQRKMKTQHTTSGLSPTARFLLVPLAVLLLYLFDKHTDVLIISDDKRVQKPFIGCIYACVLYLVILYAELWNNIKVTCKFIYSCFFKILGNCGNNQQSRLEAFYQGQAHIYDESRRALLKGRETMLALCAAQLKEQISTGVSDQRPVWVDLGGGTGWNIEYMHSIFPIEQFEKVILVDLTPSLCKIAQDRFARRGWKNVIVTCQDAATFQIPELKEPVEGRVALATLSYSLSMMDDFYPVIDRIQSLLGPQGLIGVADFYVSGRSRAPAEQQFPQLSRQCNWFTRHFWQGWFELDHIQLGPCRRDYLEYKFASLKTLNCRNHFIIPFIIQIPYYVWLGRSRVQHQNDFCCSSEVIDDTDSVVSEQSNNTLISTPQSSSSSSSSTVAVCKSYTSTSSSSFQNRAWRLDYNPDLPCHKQFRSYIYAFTWEDPRVDLQYLNLSKEDTLFLITSAGDNALEYAVHSQPREIHCVDMNPCQNHLLELKLASLHSLGFEDFWKMFGEGSHPQFAQLLHSSLSPHLSTYAYAYWNQHTDRFDSKFYKTGYSGLALTIVEWWVRLQGIRGDIDALINAANVEEQATVWMKKIRPVVFSSFIQRILHNPVFMWNALGVPKNQIRMFLEECTAQEYIESTLDPVAKSTSLKLDNYFYHLCLRQHYSKDCCPSYLTEAGFHTLKATGVLDSFRLHTSSILQALKSLPDEYLTRMIVMDHMDWFDPQSFDELDDEISEMKRALKSGGQVYWRSASTKPWYNEVFTKHGFASIEPLSIRRPGQCIDRVNMYASFYRAIKP